MKVIEEYRNQIKNIDEKILKLLDERFEISYKIGQYKRENNLPIQDIKREDMILQYVRENLKDSKFLEEIEKLYYNLLLISKGVQY